MTTRNENGNLTGAARWLTVLAAFGAMALGIFVDRISVAGTMGALSAKVMSLEDTDRRQSAQIEALQERVNTGLRTQQEILDRQKAVLRQLHLQDLLK